MKVANHKIVRHSMFFGGALSLILIPAFAQDIPFPQHRTHPERMTKEKEMHNQRFQKLDKNGDGKIIKEEFQESRDNKFACIDSNKDGYITTEELHAGTKKCK